MMMNKITSMKTVQHFCGCPYLAWTIRSNTITMFKCTTKVIIGLTSRAKTLETTNFHLGGGGGFNAFSSLIINDPTLLPSL